ncbi:N-alpha-acetyltransferase 25, NatB auxiliary subunit [Physocladia obscura]|uniref:N-alpha-acetyltransferase 25, NatB auxiliary subunit n=1 Tax=Physocladia obscura TaxID=109957 RepID=A0AAD5SZB4_9FUNG|nr:N-alpha-acetyltransferase 25, NatB auxiliary subunit [Physocladia obscura]
MTKKELYLYILVLESQQKYLACVKLLSTELAVSLCKVEAELKSLVLKYMHLAGQTDSVLDLCRNGLSSTPDDWKIHLTFIESLYSTIIEQADEQPVKNLEEVEEFKEALSFLEGLQKTTDGKIKGPLLAEIELFFKFGLFEKITPLIVQYFKRFGKVISFFEDVRKFLDVIPNDSKDSFLKSLSNEAEIEESGQISSFKKRINYYKIRFCLISVFESEKRTLFKKLLLKEYFDGLELGKDLKVTERQYGDDCLVLAVLLIIEQYHHSQDSRLLYEALYLLESGVKKSTYNFQMKIMLIRIYLLLGVSQPVVTHSLSLDVKQILLDTLTYIYADDFERIAPIDVAGQLVKKALAIYNSNEKETPEMLIQAYKFGTYSKIPEFQNFKQRLSNSIQQAISIRQVALTEILALSSPESFKHLEVYVVGLDVSKLVVTDVIIDKMSDNRDRTMNVSWKSGSGGQSFFELTSVSSDVIPTDKRSWIKTYGAIPIIVKAWVARETIDVAALRLIEGLSESVSIL